MNAPGPVLNVTATCRPCLTPGAAGQLAAPGEQAIPSQRRDALAIFYAAHARGLHSRVARRSGVAGRETIADACAYAWLQLVRRDDIQLDTGGVIWLTLVAVQEAWRLAARPERPAGTFTSLRPARGELADPRGPAEDPPVRVIARQQHRARVSCLLALKPAQREALLLQAAGFDYREIMARTSSTYTAVNRRLRQGREHLRTW
jgi:DNA-directed RNA polymerase specialized sigma24 family protein